MKTFKKLFGLSILLFCVNNANGQPQNNSVPANGKTFFIQSAIANKFITVKNFDSSDGTPLVAWSYSGESNQQFTLEDVGDGYFYLKSVLGKYVHVQNRSDKPEALALIWEGKGNDNTKWKFFDAGNGYHVIQSKKGTYLNVQRASNEDGIPIWMWTSTEDDSQLWKMIDVDDSNMKMVSLPQMQTLPIDVSVVLPEKQNPLRTLSSREREQMESLAKEIERQQKAREAKENERNAILTARNPYLNESVYLYGNCSFYPSKNIISFGNELEVDRIPPRNESCQICVKDVWEVHLNTSKAHVFLSPRDNKKYFLNIEFGVSIPQGTKLNTVEIKLVIRQFKIQSGQRINSKIIDSHIIPSPFVSKSFSFFINPIHGFDYEVTFMSSLGIPDKKEFPWYTGQGTKHEVEIEEIRITEFELNN